MTLATDLGGRHLRDPINIASCQGLPESLGAAEGACLLRHWLRLTSPPLVKIDVIEQLDMNCGDQSKIMIVCHHEVHA